MTAKNWTPEPWAIHPYACKENSKRVNIGSLNCPMTEPLACKCATDENAARIIACVNACAGINPEAVADLITLAEIIGAKGRMYDDPSGRTAVELARSALAKARG
jgi:hypothetical protein